MKIFLKNFLKSIAYGLAFCIGIVIFLFGIKARSGITSTPGDKLTSSKRNELITKLTSLETKTQNISTDGTSFAGVNIGYELKGQSVAVGSAIQRYYATCPAGKKALGGACTTANGSLRTNSSMTTNGFGCYTSSIASTAYFIRVICANVN